MGGALIVKAAENYTESAQKKLSWTVGASVSGDAENVWVEATKQIVIRCGATSITIKPESVAISTPKLDLTGSKRIEVQTGRIEHN